MFKKTSEKNKLATTSNTRTITTKSNTNASKTSMQSNKTIIKIISSKSPSLDLNVKELSLFSPTTTTTTSVQSARTKFFSNQPQATGSAYRSSMSPVTATSAAIARDKFFSEQLKLTGSTYKEYSSARPLHSYTKPAEIREIKSFYRPPIIDSTTKFKSNNLEAFTTILPYKSPYRSVPHPITYNLNYKTKPVQSNQVVQNSQLRKPIIESVSSTSTKLKPGVVYILNHKSFDFEKTGRVGTEADVKILRETFNRFKLEVNVFNDLKVSQIESKIKEIQKRDFTKRSCIIITILSHGNRRDEICAKDRPYSIDDVILFPMLQNKTLKDRTKILLIQACKGDLELRYPHIDSAAPAVPKTFYSPKEILKCYSTFEGFVSYRGKDGSIFIQEICNKIATCGMTFDIESIMKMVIESVSTATREEQIPSICSSLTKPYIFGDYI